jgi:DNA-directed RNA polymerase subunit RPC12/RpoP
MAMTDSCPNCCRRNVHPRAEHADDTQLRSAYRCPQCGHAWITNRMRDAYGPAA